MEEVVESTSPGAAGPTIILRIEQGGTATGSLIQIGQGTDDEAAGGRVSRVLRKGDVLAAVVGKRGPWGLAGEKMTTFQTGMKRRMVVAAAFGFATPRVPARRA